MTDLATLVARLQADNSQYIKALDQATGKLSKFSKDQESLLGDLANKFAAAFTIDKLIEFSVGAIESAASLEKLSQAAGVSVEELSSLRLAAAASGISQDQFALSLKKLNQNLSEAAGNATSKAGEAFRALNIDVTDSNGKLRDAGAVLNDLANRFQGFADGPNKTALAVQLLGRQGQNLIPVLNQGAQGLESFKEQAQAAGIIVSGPLADAAEDFEKKFAVLKETISGGFGNQLAAQLLPVLTELTEQLTSTTTAGEAFSSAAAGIVEVVKLISASIITVITEFKQIGEALGAIGAEAVAVAKGNFSEAAEIYRQNTRDEVASSKKAQDDIVNLLNAGTSQQLSIISTAEAEKKRIRAEAPNLAAVGESDAAIKELEKLNSELKDQVSAFGLGSAALINYKLQFGPLADAVKKAGDEGQKLAASIRANAAALQTKQDTKSVDEYTQKLQEQIDKYGQGTVAAIDYATHTGTLGQALDRLGSAGITARNHIHDLAVEQLQLKNADAFVSIDQQLLTLSGHLAQAASAAFDFQNKLLIKDVNAVGTDQQKAQLDQLKQAQVAQAAFNEEVEKGAEIQQRFETASANIALQQSTGAINDLQAQTQLDAARKQEIADLGSVYDAEKKIADQNATTLPKLTQDTQAFSNQIKGLATQTNALEKQVRDGLEQSFANNFSDLITGAESFGKAISNLLKDIEKQFADLIAKNFAQSLFGSGGAAGGVAPFLAGIFGSGGGAAATSGAGALAGTPAFAAGGTLGAGQIGIAGENGPELIYSGARDMQIVPNGASGRNVNVTNHFTVQGSGGTISRQSQMQTAAAAARSLQQASRRNNT
jgi:hypothetical protein